MKRQMKMLLCPLCSWKWVSLVSICMVEQLPVGSVESQAHCVTAQKRKKERMVLYFFLLPQASPHRLCRSWEVDTLVSLALL